MIILPLFMLVLFGICCGKKMWTFGCWVKYVKIFLGVNFILWVIKRCKEGGDIRARKEK